MKKLVIRKINKEDNKELAGIIRDVLTEFDAPSEGTALEDVSIDRMSDFYGNDRSAYFVALQDGKLIGGCGIKQLEGADSGICELQKMYLKKESRGLGAGKKLLDTCLEFARSSAYRACYLETLPGMEAAYTMYSHAGFFPLTGRLGNTGHFSCDIWLYKDL